MQTVPAWISHPLRCGRYVESEKKHETAVGLSPKLVATPGEKNKMYHVFGISQAVMRKRGFKKSGNESTHVLQLLLQVAFILLRACSACQILLGAKGKLFPNAAVSVKLCFYFFLKSGFEGWGAAGGSPVGSSAGVKTAAF